MRFYRRLVLTIAVLFSTVAGTSLADTRQFNPQVLALYDAYEAQLAILRAGGWPAVESRQTLKLGDHDPAVAALRARLQVSGELTAPEPRVDNSVATEPATSTAFDSALDAAVKAFQERHGLTADGVVGARTRDAMNVSAAQRLRQLALNIARWDALPADFDQSFLLVNLPEFRLRLYHAGDIALSMRVVIGKKNNPTPELVQQLDRFVLNPTWFVPRSIGKRELLPKVQADPGYLDKKNFDVYSGSERLNPATIHWASLSQGDFDYSFRQRPGPTNSLGRVKFILPNARSIYLHDTPQRALFERTQRAFSHGCVRLEQPLELAKALFAMQPDWSQAQVQAQLQSERTLHVKMTQPLPVYLSYLTAKVEHGKVRFFDDLYGHDRKPIAASALSSELVAKLAEVRSYRRSLEQHKPQSDALVAVSMPAG